MYENDGRECSTYNSWEIHQHPNLCCTLNLFLFQQPKSGLVRQVTSFLRSVDHTQRRATSRTSRTSDQLAAEAATCKTHTKDGRGTHNTCSGFRLRDPKNQTAADLHNRPQGHGIHSYLLLIKSRRLFTVHHALLFREFGDTKRCT
jgi:hypothetical protein